MSACSRLAGGWYAHAWRCCRRRRVTSIEADPELEPVLDAHAADYANFRFIMGDALKVGRSRLSRLRR